MITPLDIENKKFAKQMMNGYNVDEVDDFLDELTLDYGKLYKENAELKRLSYTLSKANDRIKYLEKKLENIEEKHQKEIDAIIVKTVEQVTAKLEKEHQKEITVLNKKIAKLDNFKDDEIDETIEYTLDKYPKCGGVNKQFIFS